MLHDFFFMLPMQMACNVQGAFKQEFGAFNTMCFDHNTVSFFVV